MEGVSAWALKFAPLATSFTLAFLSACAVLVAVQFMLWRKHIIFFTSYLVQARAADFNMLLHILASKREEMDESDPRTMAIDKQMDILASAKAKHYERHIDDNGNAKRP